MLGGGIESNNASIFKDLRGTMGKAKLLKRNDEACKGALIVPSKFLKIPSFFAGLRFQKSGIFTTALNGKSASVSNLAARMALSSKPVYQLRWILVR
jgi:hypothetical protein